MKTIRAFICVRHDVGQNTGKPGGAICILLNEAYASLTLRTFLRGQGDTAVIQPLSDAEASRLLGTDVDDGTPPSKGPPP
jgi:hypothetical protein